MVMQPALGGFFFFCVCFNDNILPARRIYYNDQISAAKISDAGCCVMQPALGGFFIYGVLRLWGIPGHVRPLFSDGFLFL
jgi:hypothetical protein